MSLKITCITSMRVSLDGGTRPRAHGVLVELGWAGARVRPAFRNAPSGTAAIPTRARSRTAATRPTGCRRSCGRLRWWRFWGHDLTARMEELRVGIAGSTAGHHWGNRVRNASGNAPELHGQSGSNGRTGIRLKDVRAGQDLLRPIPAHGGFGPDCLVNRGLGVRVPPSALVFPQLSALVGACRGAGWASVRWFADTLANRGGWRRIRGEPGKPS